LVHKGELDGSLHLRVTMCQFQVSVVKSHIDYESEEC
jgi:hypothetical protein